jgi:acrosin
VHGGSGSNTYTVAATPTSAGGTTTLDTGNGTDTVNVQATTQPLTVNLDGPGTINVGSTSRTLDSIQGTVTMNHLSDPGTLNVNDDGSTAAQTYTLNSSVTRTGAGLISYFTALFSVFINGGQGSNVYDVNGTENLLTTTLNTGNGRDTVNVKATTGPLTVNPGSGTDMVNIGDTSNTLNEILDVVTVHGVGSDTVNMFDQGSTTPHTYTLTASSMTRSPGGPTINFPHCRAVLHRGVTGGGSPTPPGANVINVLATDPNAPVDVVADNGDIVNVGNDADGLDEIQGSLSIDGGDGTVPVYLNDQMTASGQLYDLLPGELDRSGAAPITFQNLQQADLNGGGGGNTFDVNGVAEGAPVTINTGTGFGNLVRMRRHDQIQDALTLNGQGPSDQVGYVAYTTDVYINLLTGVATDLAGFSGFHDVTGGQGNNIIVADDSEDTINGNLPSGSAGQDLIITGGSTGGGLGTVYGSGNGDILSAAAPATRPIRSPRR